MFEYVIAYVDKWANLQDAINGFASAGWRLHTMLAAPVGGTVLAFERQTARVGIPS